VPPFLWPAFRAFGRVARAGNQSQGVAGLDAEGLAAPLPAESTPRDTAAPPAAAAAAAASDYRSADAAEVRGSQRSPRRPPPAVRQ
jgi:hypothetical protein